MKKKKPGKKRKSIGVFDSGFGGIDILRGIVNELPRYDYIYLGDTARTPYGTRSQEMIFEFSKQAVDFLFKRGCDLVIFACNTASSDALHRIQHEYLPKEYPRHPGRKVLGVLIPAAEEAAARTKNKKVGVIATEATVDSNAFRTEIGKIDPEVMVFQKAAPLLVPIVESKERHPEATELILKEYLRPLLSKNIDTLILGCTHYGILERQIKKAAGPGVLVLSEARIVPHKLAGYLRKHAEIERNVGRNGSVKFYSTDVTDRFEALGSKFFGKNIKARKVSLI